MCRRYTNNDIMSFAKVWTGYNNQRLRANIQNVNGLYNGKNYIDPLKLNALDRDRFPKTKLGGGHLGDNYPLCNARPKRHYLRKGARYLYHGQVSMFGATHDNADKKLPNIRLHFTPDAKQSGLYAQLCARDKNTGMCSFPSVVTLAETVDCNGPVECGADNIRSIKIIEPTNDDLYGYYTYVEPPCTRLMFFQEGRMATMHYMKMCADPELADMIGTACCKEAPKDTCQPDSHYHNNGNNPKRGDLCYHPTGAWDCPKGCKLTAAWNARWWDEPLCVTDASTSNADMQVCHLNLDGKVSDKGGECKYIAEPMTYKTAQERCAKEYTNGVVCNDLYMKSTPDGKSEDWRRTCSGYQADWTTTPCRMQVQVLPSGEVMSVDPKSPQGIARLKVNSANTFRVEWGDRPTNASQISLCPPMTVPKVATRSQD